MTRVLCTLVVGVDCAVEGHRIALQVILKHLKSFFHDRQMGHNLFSEGN